MRQSRLVCLSLFVVAVAAPAHATIVTLNGTTVDFLIDDAQSGLALYGGLPTVVADSLLFFPTTFRAQSNNGAGTVSTFATINFEVRSHNAATVDLGSIAVSEIGDYSITGAGGYVSAVAQLGATNLQALGPSFVQDIEQTGLLTATGAHPWSLETEIDFLLAWQRPTDRVRIDLQNNLAATSLLNPSESWIQKKFEGLRVDVAVVPLPAGLPLLLSGLTGLVALMRRRAGVSRSA